MKLLKIHEEKQTDELSSWAFSMGLWDLLYICTLKIHLKESSPFIVGSIPGSSCLHAKMSLSIPNCSQCVGIWGKKKKESHFGYFSSRTYVSLCLAAMNRKWWRGWRVCNWGQDHVNPSPTPRPFATWLKPYTPSKNSSAFPSLILSPNLYSIMYNVMSVIRISSFSWRAFQRFLCWW